MAPPKKAQKYVSSFLNQDSGGMGLNGPSTNDGGWGSWVWGQPGGFNLQSPYGAPPPGNGSVVPGILGAPIQNPNTVDLFPQRSLAESIAAYSMKTGSGEQPGTLPQGALPPGAVGGPIVPGAPSSPSVPVVSPGGVPNTLQVAGGEAITGVNGQMGNYASNMPQSISGQSKAQLQAQLAGFDQQNFANNMQMANTAIGGLQTLGNIGMSAYQLYQAGKMFDFQSGMANRNLANQAQAYQDARGDRMLGRVSANYYADNKDKVDKDIASKNKMDGSAIRT